MNRSTRVLVMVLALAMLAGTGCTVKYMNRRGPLPPQKRVAILMVDRHGDKTMYNMRWNYVYNTMLEAGLVPVSLNDVDVAELERVAAGIGGVNGLAEIAKKMSSTEFNPTLVPSLKGYLAKNNVDYLLVVSLRVSGMDESLQALLLRVDDMSVIASKFYDYSLNKQLCIPLAIIPFGQLVCPWFFLRDADEAKVAMMRELLRDLM